MFYIRRPPIGSIGDDLRDNFEDIIDSIWPGLIWGIIPIIPAPWPPRPKPKPTPRPVRIVPQPEPKPDPKCKPYETVLENPIKVVLTLKFMTCVLSCFTAVPCAYEEEGREGPVEKPELPPVDWDPWGIHEEFEEELIEELLPPRLRDAARRIEGAADYVIKEAAGRAVAQIESARCLFNCVIMHQEDLAFFVRRELWKYCRCEPNDDDDACTQCCYKYAYTSTWYYDCLQSCLQRSGDGFFQ